MQKADWEAENILILHLEIKSLHYFLNMLQMDQEELV